MTAKEFLSSIVSVWTKQIELCEKFKYKHFGKSAEDAWKFVGKNYVDLYLEAERGETEQFPGVKSPFYKCRLNKSAQFAALYLPFLHHKVPHRLVLPRRPEVPPELTQLVPTVAQYQALLQANETLGSWLMQWWLNYLPGEYGLYGEARSTIREALIKGMGVVWHETIERTSADGRATRTIPASHFDTIDTLLIDADCKQRRDAGFMIRRRERSVWQVAEEFGLKREELRGKYDSTARQAILAERGASSASEEHEHDVCTYYEIYSRIGVGHRLPGISDDLKDFTERLESIGPYVYLAIMPGLDYPLNLPPERITAGESTEMLRGALSWPIAFYEEFENPWPCSILEFVANTDNPYGTSPLEPALPLQEFLDKAYSYMMSRITVTCRNLLVVSKAMQEAFKEGLVRAHDLELLLVDGKAGEMLKDMFAIIDFPPVNMDYWKIIAMVERAFEDITAMVPLLMGTEGQRQIRSGTEAAIRGEHASSRPQDFADITENWMSSIAAKEAQMTRLHIGPEVVAPLFGEPLPEEGQPITGPLTAAWASLISTDDPVQAAAEYSYTVEAGSGRRKNKQKQGEDAQQIAQTIAPQLFAYGMNVTGNFGPYNEFLEMLGQAYDIPMSRIYLPNIMPPQQEEGKTKEPENAAV